MISGQDLHVHLKCLERAVQSLEESDCCFFLWRVSINPRSTQNFMSGYLPHLEFLASLSCLSQTVLQKQICHFAFFPQLLLKEGNVSLCPSSTNCRWNSMMLSLRRMVHETTWSIVMTILAQARIEATDTSAAPPLIMVKREQVVDILGLLEPFEEALQVIFFVFLFYLVTMCK